MKRSLLAILATLIGSLLFSSVASAQVYNFNALATDGTGFAVTTTRSGNLWTVNSVKALTGLQAPQPVTGSAGQISMAWFDSVNGVAGSQVLTPAADLAITGTAGVSTAPADWTGSVSGNTTRFSAGTPLLKNSGNFFSTSTNAITVNDPNLKSFTFDVQNGVQYQANVNLVPESSSSLLLMAALLPLAALFRRRSRNGPRIT